MASLLALDVDMARCHDDGVEPTTSKPGAPRSGKDMGRSNEGMGGFHEGRQPHPLPRVGDTLVFALNYLHLPIL